MATTAQKLSRGPQVYVSPLWAAGFPCVRPVAIERNGRNEHHEGVLSRGNEQSVELVS